MAERVGEATELVYAPGHSWAAPFLAVGLAGVLAGIFVWYPYGVAGAVIALIAARAIVKAGHEDAERLPRAQKLTTAVLPAVPPRKAE